MTPNVATKITTVQCRYVSCCAVKSTLWFYFYQTSSVGEAQKLVAQAADLLSPIHSSIQHGIQSQNDTTKGGNTHF